MHERSKELGKKVPKKGFKGFSRKYSRRVATNQTREYARNVAINQAKKNEKKIIGTNQESAQEKQQVTMHGNG